MQTLLLIGIVVLGGGLGAVLGHVGKCSSGACPLTATPWRGAALGAVAAALFGSTLVLSPRRASTPHPAGTLDDPSHLHHAHADLGPSSVVHVGSEEQFGSEVLGGKELWLVDFYADWCGACRMLAPVIFRFPKSARLKADLYVEDGQDLREYGFDAMVVHLPGHSKGSIGVLTDGGDMFCGDLLENLGEPSLGSIVDDVAAANASVEKLRGLDIGVVYPGHGQPFPMAEFLEAHP